MLQFFDISSGALLHWYTMKGVLAQCLADALCCVIEPDTLDRELLIDPLPPTRGNFVHYDFLKLHYICSKMTHVSPLAVGALLCYSHVNYVTP